MSGAYAFDTECTSLEDDREIIEAAWIPLPGLPDLAGDFERLPVHIGTAIDITAMFDQRYCPTKRTTLGALAVHHILPDEVECCPPSSTCKLPDGVVYIVGHNIDFDWEAIGKPNVKRIDTDAMARYVWPDLDAYSQSALLYHVLGATEATRQRLREAHRAAHDVLNNIVLLDHIILSAPRPITTWPELHAYSEECRIPRVMPIGDKQGLKGLPLAEAYAADPGFVRWCLNQAWLDPYLRKGLEAVIDKSRSQAQRAVFARDDHDDDGEPF